MATVRLSSKYQVVIPREVRERVDLAPGQEIEVLVYGDRIQLIPVRPMHEMRGFLAGIDTQLQREPDREL